MHVVLLDYFVKFIFQLLGEKDNHDERVRKVSESLKQSEALGHDASLQHTELLKQVGS